MANNRTLTSANAILLISVAGLFDVAQRIQGFATDDMTDVEATDSGETSMGIDGRLSAGFVPMPVSQNIMLQADSESLDLFERWDATEQAIREKYVASGSLLVIATGRKYDFTRGFLRSFVRTPSLKKTLQPRRVTIMWERVTPAPY